MKLIPVIDLMHGHVVRARQGLRSQYRPIESRLVQSSVPEDIVAALLNLYPFDTIYIADLDAIQQTGNHFSAIERMAARFPQTDFWVDAGISRPRELERWLRPGFRPVIGSESLGNLSLLEEDAILSLDFDEERLRGPADLLGKPAVWPDDVIIMSLKRVGSQRGPDFERIAQLRKLAPQKNYYCAGGVRCLQDLRDLKKMEISGVLLASALHDGTLSAAELGSACSLHRF